MFDRVRNAQARDLLCSGQMSPLAHTRSAVEVLCAAYFESQPSFLAILGLDGRIWNARD